MYSIYLLVVLIFLVKINFLMN